MVWFVKWMLIIVMQKTEGVRMKNIALITWAFVSFISSPANAKTDDFFWLNCKGDIETNQDLKVTRKPTIINALVNLQQSTVKINNDWGCLVDCNRVLPVEISDSEISFSNHNSSDSDSISMKYGFTINRYTGTFSASGLFTTKAGSGAAWSMIIYTSVLECTIEKKKF
jgi:hypothetical protein